MSWSSEENRVGVVSVASRLGAERSGVRLTAGRRNSPLLHNVQTGPEANPASYSMTTGVLNRGQNGQGEKLTIHLRLVSRLIINGGIHLVHLHAFITWLGKTRSLSLSLFFFCNVRPYLRQKRRWMVGGMSSKLSKGRDRYCNDYYSGISLYGLRKTTRT
jgi:hypothetical protein